MMNFEACPYCSQGGGRTLEQMKSMVLSGDDKSMQCDICNHSFKLPDCESLREVARQQRKNRYAKN